LTAEGEDYVDKLIAALRHFEPTRAALAIQILSEMLAEPRAILPLIELLDTAQDAYVLHSAVVALGRFADPRAVPALAQRTLDLTAPLVVRLAAVDALSRIGGDAAGAAQFAAPRMIPAPSCASAPAKLWIGQVRNDDRTGEWLLTDRAFI
jgi:hypothetical protein